MDGRSIILAAALCLASCSNLREQQAIDRLQPCKHADGPTDGFCGTLDVFEDRDARSGRKIALKIIVFPALKRSAAKDPLFFLAGGPGQGAADIARMGRELLRRIGADRDLVFVDQRGTGKSNPLECKPDKNEEDDDSEAKAIARLRACMESLGLHAPLLALLGRLAGAPVEVPEEGGQTYAAVTIRRLPPGLEVAVHSERWAWPSMGWHRARLTPRWHLSFYLPLNALPDGGELELFHRPAEGQSLEGLSPAAARDRLAAFGTTTLRPGPGDLLLFDGGRFNHRVCPSTTERWTLGGFAGRDAAGKLWVWS